MENFNFRNKLLKQLETIKFFNEIDLRDAILILFIELEKVVNKKDKKLLSKLKTAFDMLEKQHTTNIINHVCNSIADSLK